MVRRYPYAAVALAAALALLGGCRSRPKPRHLVAICGSPFFEPIFQGLKSQLDRLGYREGVQLTYEFRLYDLSAGPAAGSLSVAGADLVLAFPTDVALAAKEAARREGGPPVVFAYAGIERPGLIESVRRPGGNITGVRFPGPEMIGKRLEIIHRIAPHARRVWLGYQAGYPNNEPALAVLRPLAESLGVRLVEVPVPTPEDLTADFDRRDRARDPGIDAMVLMPDALGHSPRGWQLIKAFAARHRLPVAGSFLYTVREGAVFGNESDLAELGRLAAPLVVKVLQGIPAGSIPVVTPEQDLYINYRRARELGLQVPEGLLRQATVVIQ